MGVFGLGCGFAQGMSLALATIIPPASASPLLWMTNVPHEMVVACLVEPWWCCVLQTAASRCL